jgi:excisionase family DNA binding protein
MATSSDTKLAKALRAAADALDTRAAQENEASLSAVVSVPTLLTVAQAGQILGCSPHTVRRRIADGSIPAVREHERTMIRGDELRAYIDGLGRAGPAAGVRRTRAPRTRRYDFLRE